MREPGTLDALDEELVPRRTCRPQPRPAHARGRSMNHATTTLTLTGPRPGGASGDDAFVSTRGRCSRANRSSTSPLAAAERRFRWHFRRGDLSFISTLDMEVAHTI